MALLDVRPDGKAISLAAGQVRARYRKSIRHPRLLKPGEVFGYDVDLWETGISIPAGHRLRVVVTSTLFPDTDRNLNTGEPVADATRMVVAHQTVFHDRRRASFIELPVLRRKGVA
jgi:putative CocE/NonD family hydrolase